MEHEWEYDYGEDKKLPKFIRKCAKCGLEEIYMGAFRGIENWRPRIKNSEKK